MACQEGEKRKILQEISDNSEEKTPKRSKTTPFGSGKKSRSRQLAAARRKPAECRKNDENYNNNNGQNEDTTTTDFPATPGPLLASTSSNGFVSTTSTSRPIASDGTPYVDCFLVKGPTECSSGFKLRVLKLATGDIETTKGMFRPQEHVLRKITRACVVPIYILVYICV